MRSLVPLKVKIELEIGTGYAKYPDFNQLDSRLRLGLDWSKFIDSQGTGWHYDCCGHQESEPGSPIGIQWGLLLVPKNFADAAITAFPSLVTKMTELEFQTFYEAKITRDQTEQDVDENVLQKIKFKQDMNIALTPTETRSLNPNNRTRGIRKNELKKWIDFKKLKEINIVQ